MFFMCKFRQSLIVISVISMLWMAGCATTDEDANTAGGLYRLAEKDIENDRYILALEKFRKVKNKFPYSKYSMDAQLRIADVYFLQDAFPEAALSYQTFVELHPNHKKAGYAMFRVGESHYHDIPSTIARDLTPAYDSQKAFEIYLARFPSDKHSPKAKELLNDTLEKLARKELYIGSFYLKRDRPKSARKRFEKLLKLYSKTKTASVALELLKKAVNAEKDQIEALLKEERNKETQQ